MKRIAAYTLVEMIMVITLTTIIAGVLGIYLRQGFLAYATSKPMMPIAIKTNIALDNILREIKSAQQFTSIGTTSMTFVNQAGTSVTIAQSGQTITRTAGTGAKTALNNVSSIRFDFYSSTFAVATALSTRYVLITLSILENNLPYSVIAGTTVRKLL